MGQTPVLAQRTYVDFTKAVGNELGYGYDNEAWTPDELYEIDRIVQSGYMRAVFLCSHQWSWLKPVMTLSLEANVGDYLLPLDFGGIIGNAHFATADEGWHSIQVMPPEFIMEKRQRSFDNISTSWPSYCATRPKKQDGQSIQRWEMLFYSNPSSAFDIQFRYQVRPINLSDDYPYPLGGAAMGEVILESVLAVAEQHGDNSPGVHTSAYIGLLQQAIDEDRKVRNAGHYGYNDDRSDYMEESYPYRTESVTYGGPA